MATTIPRTLMPRSSFIEPATGRPTKEWLAWLMNPTFLSIDLSTAIPVVSGGTGLISGVSGGVLAFTNATTLTSSAVLGLHQIVLGGGAGGVPSTPLGTGTSVQVLHGSFGGTPTWGQVALGTDVTGNLPVGRITGLATVATTGAYSDLTGTPTIPTVPNFADNEVPSGTINGSNVTFTLAHAPNPATSLLLFLNGLKLAPTTDYSLSSATITYVVAPSTGDTHNANYRY